jgi:hypothetical protein
MIDTPATGDRTLVVPGASGPKLFAYVRQIIVRIRGVRIPGVFTNQPSCFPDLLYKKENYISA